MSSRPPALESTGVAAHEPLAARRERSRAGGWPRRLLRLGIALVATLWLAFVVGWLSLHWLILPHIERWRGPLEAHASRALGAPVRFATIQVTSSSWVPAVVLGDVRVLDAQQRTALALPRVSLALSPRSLLALDLRFSQIHIEGARLDVRRDAAGRIFVAGLDVDGGGSATSIDSEAGVADWFFRQSEFVIRHGTLRWIDEARQAPPLALREVDVVVRNHLRGHDVRIDATPPADWGDRFTLRGRFTQPLFAPAGDWRRWSGESYVELPRADVRQLGRHVTLPFALAAGDGALRGWLSWRDGRPQRATVDVALRAVALRLAPELDPLAFAEIQGRVVAERDGGLAGDRHRIVVEQLGFVTGDGAQWPRGDLRFTWREATAARVVAADAPAASAASATPAASAASASPLSYASAIAEGEFSAERLDIGVMAGIAGGLPLGAPLRKLLAEVDPRGTVSDLKASWRGPLDAPEAWRVGATLDGLRLAAHAPEGDAVGRPGLENARLRLDADQRGGTARIGMADGALVLPGVFADPSLRVDRFDARLAWQVDTPAGQPMRVRAQVEDASFSTPDGRAEFTAQWETGGGSGSVPAPARDVAGRFPGHLRFDGRVLDADATRVARYLPLGLPAEARDYVARAVRQGRIAEAAVHIAGDLRHFPFLHARAGGRAPADGAFRVTARVEDLTFAYSPGDPQWPVVSQGYADVVYDRARVTIRNARLRYDSTEWRQVEGQVDPLAAQPRLDIKGATRAPLADMLRIVGATPVGRWIGGALDGAAGTGPADLQLALGIPLGDDGAAAVKGQLVLNGNDVRMRPDLPLLAAVRGRVEFTEAGFTLPPATARMLGGDVTLQGGQAPHGEPRFSLEGTATAEALRRATELGMPSRLARALEGQAAYRATLAFPDGRPQLGVTSDLVGVGLALPPPLGKTASTALPLLVRTHAEPGAPSRDTLWIGLGRLLQARVVRDAATDRVQQAMVRIDAPTARDGAPATAAAGPGALPLPASGLSLQVVAERLDVEAWQAAAARVLGGEADARPAAVAAPASGAAGAVDTGDVGDDANGWWPTHVALRARELDVASRRLDDVVLGATRVTTRASGERWRANLSAAQVEGYLEYSPPERQRSAGGVYARLARLSLPRGEADPTETLLDRPPDSVPSLDIVVDAFELRGKKLGRFEVEAVNRDRTWQLRKLALTMPEARLRATGQWQPGQARRAGMDFTLDLDDSGAFLERLGMGRAVQGGRGRLDGYVEWPGSPLAPDIARLDGRVRVAIEKGQFLKASPGAARLLGVLSLQSLPRRLLLDFRDLFGEGFAFDNVLGNVVIAGGVASTENLRMKGTSAGVLMAGEADLARETQDLRVLVVPETSVGAASLAYALVNPAIGLGAFVAQYLLARPLAEAGTREFHITGSWDDPKVDRVERAGAAARAASAASAAEAVATSASAPPAR